MNYKIIKDGEELEKFKNLLPDLEDDQVFFLILFARKKYGEIRDITLRRVTATKDTLERKLKAMEAPQGAYLNDDGSVIDQDSLAVYINPNPRSLTRATGDLLVELAKKVRDGVSVNPQSLALTSIQTSVGNKKWVHFDIDVPEDYPKFDVKHSVFHDVVNPGALILIKTRGGYHALIDSSKVSDLYKNSFYQNIRQHPFVDVCTDQILPIPGTNQGGFIPKIVD